MEAENSAQANGHVGIPGKIEVNVQSKRNCVQPRERHGWRPAVPVELYQHGKVIRQNDLFRKAHEESPQTQPHIFPAVGSPIQLLRHIGIADDGASNELGEQSNVGPEGDEIFLRRHRAPVHVHGVAQALEGVEADAHGQGQLQKRQAQAGDGIDADEEKVRIFEKPQQAHAHGNGQGQPRLFVMLAAPDGKTAQVENSDGEYHPPQ